MMAAQKPVGDNRILGEDGFWYIPGTQRADGTWRKPRRVKDGYVPQEEVPVYESKGKQFQNAVAARRGQPVGYAPAAVPTADQILDKVMNQTEDGNETTASSKSSSSKRKARKKAAAERSAAEDNETANNTSATNQSQAQNSATSQLNLDDSEQVEKRLRNLRKKLKEIEGLQSKLDSGELQTPEKTQLEKLERRTEVESQISELESVLRALQMS